MFSVVGFPHYLFMGGRVGRALVSLQAGVVIVVFSDGLFVLVDGGKLAPATFHVVFPLDVSLDGLDVRVTIIGRSVLGLDVPAGVGELLQICKEFLSCH